MPEEMTGERSDVRSTILALLKKRGEATTQEIAAALQVSYEAVRQQVKQLEASGLIECHSRPNPAGTGRPLGYYSLSTAGDHLFPKQYDELTVALIDAVGDTLGRDALREVLAALADRQVADWEPRLAGMDVEARLDALRAIYRAADPFTEVVAEQQGPALVERNCPYLNVAMERPALCSLTVSVLSRLLGYRVTRVKRFQDGDGRCVFRMQRDQPMAADALPFEFEGPKGPVEKE